MRAFGREYSKIPVTYKGKQVGMMVGEVAYVVDNDLIANILKGEIKSFEVKVVDKQEIRGHQPRQK